jgi:divalent metal cation (Fe/Co/Zn/Cd) transporter
MQASAGTRSAMVLWLQGITLAWMLVECGISLSAAVIAHSPAMAAFGSDSLVELMSATVVLLQYSPRFPLSQRTAARAASILLFVLAGVVTIIAILGLGLRFTPEATPLGIGITAVALIAMPLLAWLKRREARRSQNRALAADAIQSATCAYLAGITLVGLACNAAFHIPWFDSGAAIAALPLLLKEGRDAWRGESCGCCNDAILECEGDHVSSKHEDHN